MAIVKANAYGHGLVEIARETAKMNASYLGVARLEEGITLRMAGLDLPVLIMGYTPRDQFHLLYRNDLTQTICRLEDAELLNRMAGDHGYTAKIHVKFDSGMGRLGMIPTNQKAVVHDICKIDTLPHIDLEGIFTHFASADSLDKRYATYQFAVFMDLIDALRREGVQIPLRHAANSAAVIDMPETHLDLVRPGICLYGLYPFSEVNKEKIHLTPAMSLKSYVVQKKHVGTGFKVSYGPIYETPRATTIVAVPVGYADGYNRLLSSRGFMLIQGRRVPVVGRICMDLTMVDVGDDASDINVEDEVGIFGSQQGETISVDEVANMLNIINYEVVTSVTSRVKRVYVEK